MKLSARRLTLVAGVILLGAGAGANYAYHTPDTDPDEEGLHLVVNVPANRLYVYENGERTRTYAVSVGLQGYETPAGSYTIVNGDVASLILFGGLLAFGHDYATGFLVFAALVAGSWDLERPAVGLLAISASVLVVGVIGAFAVFASPGPSDPGRSPRATSPAGESARNRATMASSAGRQLRSSSHCSAVATAANTFFRPLLRTKICVAPSSSRFVVFLIRISGVSSVC